MRSVLLAASILAVCASAADMKIDDVTVGSTVVGPDLSLKDLKGKVVYVEYWGTR